MTNKTEKMTNRKALSYVLDNCTVPADVAEKLTAMIAALDKKNASPKKLTAQQEKNEGVKADLLAFLSDHEGEGFTVSDLLKMVPTCEGDSNQHVSALMRQLYDEGRGPVEKYTEKRRTYFRAVTAA